MPDVRDPQTIALRGDQLPQALRSLKDPPAQLFTRGAWPPGACIAIVGARTATAYGRAVAGRLAGDLASMGIAIVSGLARGIDAAAHEGALRVGGRTVAILPGSLDVITPSSHTELASRIAASGALAAEWETGMQVTRGLFLRRNRLIAGLSLATVVVEAAERSGALATAAIAKQLGRPVLAVPGDIDRPTSRGCHALLRGGARICEAANDVLDCVGVGVFAAVDAGPRSMTPLDHGRRLPAETPAAGNDVARVAAILDHEPLELGGISRRAALAPQRTLAALLELQWSGVAETHPGPRWSARNAARVKTTRGSRS